jgi:hypothetical protein
MQNTKVTLLTFIYMSIEMIACYAITVLLAVGVFLLVLAKP